MSGEAAVERKPLEHFLMPGGAGIVFVHVEGEDIPVGDPPSYVNEKECEWILSSMLQVQLDTSSIGVITPYSAQKEKLKRMFRNARVRDDVVIDTVDAFQGQERDVIFFSPVRANPDREIGFLSDSRRLNVAVTRAKRALIVLGNYHTLSYGGSVWRGSSPAFLQHLEPRGFLVDESMDPWNPATAQDAGSGSTALLNDRASAAPTDGYCFDCDFPVSGGGPDGLCPICNAPLSELPPEV